MPKKEMTDAQKAKLKRMVAKGSKINLDKPKPKKASTSYSPAPMSAAAKAKAGAAGAASKKASSARKVEKLKSTGLKKTNLDKTARGPKAGTSTVASIAKRFGVTAREARDIYTAVGSAAQALRKSPQENMPVSGAFKNVGKQIKEVAKAAATGKKGTTAYKITPNRVSKENRKREGNKGYVFYDIKNPKQR